MRVLNFFKCNLYKYSKEVKSKACLTLVRPILDYAPPVWDPHLIKDSDELKRYKYHLLIGSCLITVGEAVLVSHLCYMI